MEDARRYFKHRGFAPGLVPAGAKSYDGSMRMNSPEGKSILAVVRGGAFAHAGETEAVDLALRAIPKDENRAVLDAGCGLGGTADYVQKNGWGRVTGFDIDAVSIGEARKKFPDCTFAVSDVGAVGNLWQGEFGLITCFNTLYAFPDQPRALGELAKVAREGATLVVFDYTDPQQRYAGSDFAQAADASFWRPLQPGGFKTMAAEAGWRLVEFANVSSEYLRWYDVLVERIEAHRGEVIAKHSEEKYTFVLRFYTALRQAIKEGILGGGIFTLRRA